MKKMEIYNNLTKNKNIIRKIRDTEVFCNFNDGAYVEVRSSNKKRLKVEIYNSLGDLEYSSEIDENMWCKTNKIYFDEYRCIVTDLNDDEVIFDHRYNAKNKRVYIAMESKSLGDTMAWFPYIDEFRKKHDCHVVCSTFWNHLFENQYPELEFIKPGDDLSDIYATYRLGFFFDGEKNIKYDKHKLNPRRISLQRIATDILGLENYELRPKLVPSKVEKKKRVGIGIHSTAQAKYWNNPTGWQEVTDFLISKGYEVVVISKEHDGYMGNFFPKGSKKIKEESVDDLIDNLNSCEFFIGVSSGLSWLSWSLAIPTVIISGFTADELEPYDGVVRIANRSSCNDCWSRHKFDPGDWNWCPDHKGTERQFECSKTISGDMVINKLLISGLVKSNDLKEDDEKILKFFEDRYEVITNQSGSYNISTEDIILKKKN
jgi:autotransporter strand-loop-strand O-heptosyltransferase